VSKFRRAHELCIALPKKIERKKSGPGKSAQTKSASEKPGKKKSAAKKKK
jgi:hypothetical protein